MLEPDDAAADLAYLVLLHGTKTDLVTGEFLPNLRDRGIKPYRLPLGELSRKEWSSRG